MQNSYDVSAEFGLFGSAKSPILFIRISHYLFAEGTHNNLTFWRPIAPSNYVILGDCVTSRYGTKTL